MLTADAKGIGATARQGEVKKMEQLISQIPRSKSSAGSPSAVYTPPFQVTPWCTASQDAQRFAWRRFSWWVPLPVGAF